MIPGEDAANDKLDRFLGGGRARVGETTDWDPRSERARSVEGAKARYVGQEGYDEADLERDLERLLSARRPGEAR